MSVPFYQIQDEQAFDLASERATTDPEAYWSEIATTFYWRKKWDKVLEWNFDKPDIKWFVNGKLNITENCIDRHIVHQGNKVAIIWEPNNPSSETRTITYCELAEEVNRFANVLVSNGVKKGDRVAIYLPMIPEAVFAMLACARIGAIHSVVFAGFSAISLADRINDARAKVVITSDGLIRGDKKILLRNIVADALEKTNCVVCVITIRHTGDAVETNHLDVRYDEARKKASDQFVAAEMDSEDVLFILYTSGSTGKPKGVVHSCGGYMVYADYSFRNVFQYENNDIFWCTADVGWVTGHSYIVYGPLLAGATCLLYEGIPNWPDAGRFWQICEKHGVTKFYTAPTAIRSLMTYGSKIPDQYSLSSLKIIGSVGEPINSEAWNWYHEHVGKKRCPIVDTWWQTETGGILISDLGAIGGHIPTFAGRPLPGIQPVLLTAEGKEIAQGEAEGLLAIKFPWPSILRSTWGDHQRCRQTYFSVFPGYYFTGDGAKRDAKGQYRIIGRVDDVINVSGHRIGTAEIENAINEHPAVVESAVVGYPHEIKGQAIYAFVCLLDNNPADDATVDGIRELTAQLIGKLARPDKIQFVPGLPKTRSGKIMRRILRKVAEGNYSDLGDTTTLLDPQVVEHILTGRK